MSRLTCALLQVRMADEQSEKEGLQYSQMKPCLMIPSLFRYLLRQPKDTR